MNDTPDTCLARVPRDLKSVIEALVRLHTGNGAAGDVEKLVKVLAPHYSLCLAENKENEKC